MFERFVGIPYVAHGRDYFGADCWGILYLFYRDVLGVDIPSYVAEMEGKSFDRHGIAPLMEAERDIRWKRVQNPVHGDGVSMRVGRMETHVGVYLDRGRLLHSEGPNPSEIVRIDDIRVKSRIAGFYRFNAC
ncbi:MAG: C40 family peptidase [Rhizobiales bacterium]|nr:C40 family peptidase [Hyphomicrobiales bacterium]